MAKFEDLEDVTISNPKAGDVVKYTATGWVNGADATGTPPGGNPCGTMDGYTRDDREETITEMWKWEVDTDGNCGIRVENEDGVNNLDEYAEVCPGRVVVGNNLGRGELKARDLGKVRLSASEILFFQDRENPSGVTLSELVACCDTGGGEGGVTKIIAGPGIGVSPTSGTGEVTVRYTGEDPDNVGTYPTRFLNFGKTSITPYEPSVTGKVPNFAQQTENIPDLPAEVKKYILQFEVGSSLSNYGAGAGIYGRIRQQWDIVVSTGTLTPNNRTALNLIVNNPPDSGRGEHVLTGRSTKTSVLDLGDDWEGGDLNITVYLGYLKLAKASAAMGHGRVILTPIPPELSEDEQAAFISTFITVDDDDTESIFDDPLTPEQAAKDLDIDNKEYLKLAVLAVTGAYNFGNYDPTILAQLKQVGEQLYALQAQNDIDGDLVVDTINIIIDPVRQYLVFSWDYSPTNPTTRFF